MLEPERLSEVARRVVAAPENDVFLSSVSAWEIAVTWNRGKLMLDAPAERWVPRWRDAHGIAPLSLDETSALHVTRLPDLHRDPFDRMLVSQALVHGLHIVTPDEQIASYPARTVW